MNVLSALFCAWLSLNSSANSFQMAHFLSLSSLTVGRSTQTALEQSSHPSTKRVQHCLIDFSDRTRIGIRERLLDMKVVKVPWLQNEQLITKQTNER